MSNNRLVDAVTTIWGTNPGIDLGAIFENGYGDRYMFVKNDSADTNAAAYKFAFAKTGETSSGRGKVTMKDGEVTNGNLGTVTRPEGVWQAAVPYGSFGFIQISGRGYVFTDGGVVDGDYLVADGGATVDGIADTAGAGEEHAVVALALANDDGTPVAWCRIFCQ